MRLPRSTFYEVSSTTSDHTAIPVCSSAAKVGPAMPDLRSFAPADRDIIEAMATICDEFEHYGWRRVQAALRHQGMIVNHKKIRRLMR